MYTYITYLNIYFIKIRMMMNPTLGKPEEDLAVYDYTDISMNVCLKKYEYIFDPWTNDSRYLYSNENMQNEIEALNELMKSKVSPAFSYLFMTIGFIGMFVFYKMKNDLSMGFIFACIFLVSFSHYIMCIICSYIITKDVIKSVETRIKSLNIKYKKEKIYFKLINLSSFGLKYLKLFTLSKGQAYFTLRVIYKYCKII
uniref:Mutant PFC0460w n=1 Tax=Plasmodium falciparum (isolate 3D7) TaxID=36329 RepID=G4XF29_PLAF7|nr:mutant PFC0460w [Plasmodium falciparum 3D7]